MAMLGMTPRRVPDDPNLFGGIGSAIGSRGQTEPGARPPATTVAPTVPPVTSGTPTTTPTTPITPPTTPALPATTPTTAPPKITPAAGFNSSGQYAPQNDSVVDQVNSITAANSPLMQRAAGIGAAIANSRGLQNSTLAAQSGEKAFLDQAVPIASQEAQQAYGKNLQFMQGQTQTSIASMQTAAASQAAFSQALLAASQSYSANVGAIMSNPDLSASSRQAALDAAAAQRDADFGMVQKVYGVSISGSAGTGAGSGTGSGTGTATPGTYSGPSKAAILTMQNDGTAGNFNAAAGAWNAAHPTDLIPIPGGSSGSGLTWKNAVFGLAGSFI